MKKLILHIGFPKTGTTTLQHIFSKCDDVIYDTNNRLKKKLYLSNDSDFVRNIEQEICCESKKDCELVFFSNEGFIGQFLALNNDAPDLDYFMSRIGLIHKSCKEKNIEFYVLVGLRKPSNLLTSYYTHRHHFFAIQRQQNLASYTREFLESQIAYALNYDYLTSQLSQNSDKVISYKFEEFWKLSNQDFYIEELFHQIGIDSSNLRGLEIPHKKERGHMHQHKVTLVDILPTFVINLLGRAHLEVLVKILERLLGSISMLKTANIVNRQVSDLDDKYLSHIASIHKSE